MKENERKCYKCACSPAHDRNITLHRFPKPGRTNSLRCELWAKYCFPDDSWWSPEFQNNLHSRHLMLCTKHFKKSSFIDNFGKRLVKSAVPDEECEKECYNVPSTCRTQLNQAVNHNVSLTLSPPIQNTVQSNILCATEDGSSLKLSVLTKNTDSDNEDSNSSTHENVLIQSNDGVTNASLPSTTQQNPDSDNEDSNSSTHENVLIQSNDGVTNASLPSTTQQNPDSDDEDSNFSTHENVLIQSNDGVTNASLLSITKQNPGNENEVPFKSQTLKDFNVKSNLKTSRKLHLGKHIKTWQQEVKTQGPKLKTICVVILSTFVKNFKKSVQTITKNSDDIKAYALTYYFYSPKAYNFSRKSISLHSMSVCHRAIYSETWITGIPLTQCLRYPGINKYLSHLQRVPLIEVISVIDVRLLIKITCFVNIIHTQTSGR
ncbi:unnamed protein product [Parnassius mnemosyne]|uniref:THAP-type domain-containing protein n=1 Tax=Parnassius mnemosyne TaxID=213953 RepID=A0AAV1L0D1_9NEOP